MRRTSIVANAMCAMVARFFMPLKELTNMYGHELGACKFHELWKGALVLTFAGRARWIDTDGLSELRSDNTGTTSEERTLRLIYSASPKAGEDMQTSVYAMMKWRYRPGSRRLAARVPHVVSE